MQTIRIFLASSSELKAERDALRQYLSTENDRLYDRGLYLKLVQWEYFLDAVSNSRLQDAYNAALKQCDICITLFHTRAGRYTVEEFDTALAQFQTTGKPLIYTYFKTGSGSSGDSDKLVGNTSPDLSGGFIPADEAAQHLQRLKQRLSDIGHFYTHFNNVEGLLLHFRQQLDLLEDKGLLGVSREVQTETREKVQQYLLKNAVINSTITAEKVHIGDVIVHKEGKKIPQQLTPYTPINPATECIGREAELQNLADTLTRAQRAVVVNGLGGIGKTTLAKAWFQQVKDRYNHWAWIESAGNDAQPGASGIVETIARHPTLAENLGLALGEKEEPLARFAAVMNALRKLEGPNLLVIDNAGSELGEHAIYEQLPLPHGWHVLLTSRSRLNGYEVVPLDRLKPEHAAALFRQYYTAPCTDAELDALLQELDYHTLSLELIAKTLQEHLGSLSLPEMTEKLRRRQLDDPDLQRRISSNHSKEETDVYAHLLVTFQCAGLDEAGRLLLARMAALPPAGAYTAAELEEWLQVEPAGRRDLHETLSRLERKGWLSRSPEQHFSIHRMVQQAVLYQLRPGMAELGVLVETFTKKLDFDVSTNYTLLFPWIPHAEQVLSVLPEEERGHKDVSRLMNNLGIVMKETGQYERARELLEAALASAMKNFGAEHPNVAVSQSNLAEVYRNLGQYERGRELLEAALASDLKNFGAEHPTVAVSLNNLAHVYKDMGEVARARELFERALEIFVHSLGEGHPYVALVRESLAALGTI